VPPEKNRAAHGTPKKKKLRGQGRHQNRVDRWVRVTIPSPAAPDPAPRGRHENRCPEAYRSHSFRWTAPQDCRFEAWVGTGNAIRKVRRTCTERWTTCRLAAEMRIGHVVK